MITSSQTHFLCFNPGYMKSIQSSSCICPYPTNLAQRLQCAMKALSSGSLPGGLIYEPLPLNPHSAVRKSEIKITDNDFVLLCCVSFRISRWLFSTCRVLEDCLSSDFGLCAFVFRNVFSLMHHRNTNPKQSVNP